VVPSLYEGFSLRPSRPWRAACPGATTGGALPEVVGTDGETGLLVAPDDRAPCARHRRLLDDPSCVPGSARPDASACCTASPGR